ncbi:ABC transporter substrate-binding protein [Conexibacter sp. DBS9H8]|uniref:ABC transporter substrate-binding protein n=1 Tax=Conexibacter sp. DBS9H8 TaxID=2937801 RepID=UPI00200ED25A|nr:ABC transporter substrate-binding protein [Conexibacter sp. DBS9H8]
MTTEIRCGRTGPAGTRRRALAVGAAALIGAASIAACGSSTSSSAGSSAKTASGGTSVNWATATSAAQGGGMAALVAAAKKEGKLNVITLPANWANYGTQMKEFSQMYGIKIHDAIPSGSSAQEIQAIESGRGSSTAPDVVDVGESFAVQDANLFAPYKVQSWNMIPAANKDPNGNWYNDYGGYVSFGCDLKVVSSCPTTWSQLTSSKYHKAVALNGVPGQAGAATGAVQAAALNNGGSFANVKPGLAFFNKLKANGNFNATDCDAASLIEAGQCPIIINWDFLNVAGAWGLPKGSRWVVNVPNGPAFAEYYAQAISKTAPDPAAARLWEEFLYSNQGQNNFLKGYARPVELAALVKNGTVDKAAYAKLPPIHNVAQYPTIAEETNAGKVIAAGWSA